MFIGVLTGIHGRNAGMFGLSLFRRGGKSQLILYLMGPLPPSILGFEEDGLRFKSSRRSSIGGGINTLGASLERGTSSFDFVGVLSGNFIGEITLLGFLDSLFVVVAVGPQFLAPDGPGFGSLIWCFSFLE